MKFYLSIVLDCIFTFLLTNIVVRFFLHLANINKNVVIISVLLSLSVTIPVFFVIKNKKIKKIDKLQQQKNQKQVLYQLNFLTEKQILNLFVKAFTHYNQSPVIKNKFIYLPKKDAYVTHVFSFENLNCDTLINKIKTQNIGKKSLYVFTNCLNCAPQFLTNLPFVKYFNGSYLYNFLKQSNSLPQITTNIKKEPLFNKILNNVLKKQNIFKYIIYACILFFIAFFVPYKLYYTISGSLFLMLAVCSFIFNIKKSAPTTDAELFNN